MVFVLLIAMFGLFYALGYIHARTKWKRFHDEQMVRNNTVWTETWRQERQAHNDTIRRVLQRVRAANDEAAA